jgi:hypothetical protein
MPRCHLQWSNVTGTISSQGCEPDAGKLGGRSRAQTIKHFRPSAGVAPRSVIACSRSHYYVKHLQYRGFNHSRVQNAYIKFMFQSENVGAHIDG